MKNIIYQVEYRKALSESVIFKEYLDLEEAKRFIKEGFDLYDNKNGKEGIDSAQIREEERVYDKIYKYEYDVIKFRIHSLLTNGKWDVTEWIR
jgi:hypothetical protein